MSADDDQPIRLSQRATRRSSASSSLGPAHPHRPGFPLPGQLVVRPQFWIAVDLSRGVQSFRTRQHAWLVANAGDHGWFLPDWAQRGGSRPEPWHWEYSGAQ